MALLLENSMIFKIIVVALLSIIVVQLLLLLRIRQVLKNMSYYVELLSKFFYRFGNTGNKPVQNDTSLRTCQFCKFRMSFIHMGEKDQNSEDFYYRCKLRNADISLKDTCDHFEGEKTF
jgi:hypothetical protein